MRGCVGIRCATKPLSGQDELWERVGLVKGELVCVRIVFAFVLVTLRCATKVDGW